MTYLVLKYGSKRLFPELISLVIVLFNYQKLHEANSLEFVGLTLIITCLIRCVWNIALLIHGLGHCVLATIIDLNPDFLRVNNVLENRSWLDFFSSFMPLTPTFIPGVGRESSLWIEVGDCTPWKVRLKGLGGPLLNLMAILFTMICLPTLLRNLHNDLDITHGPIGFFLCQLLVIIFATANLLILISSRTDLMAMVTGQAELLYCGNFGFVGLRHISPNEETELLPEGVLSLFRIMGAETEIRGEQAGGGLCVGRDRYRQTVFVGQKIVNSKRGKLTESLERAFRKTRKKAIRSGVKPLKSTAIGAWHYRFGTSGPPSVRETHWHEWCQARIETVWQIENGQWLAKSKNINHRITHNGDFDGWKFFQQVIDNARLGLWLERVLHTPNHTVGDSPKIAGLLDLLTTQGMWTASVRLAYQVAIASSLEDAFDGQSPKKEAPNTAPSEADLRCWSDIFATVFVSHTKNLSFPEDIFNSDNVNQLKQDIVQKLLQLRRLNQLSKQRLTHFAGVAIHAFFNNDIYRATQILIAKAQGSFGLAVLSTLKPHNVVLCALGQPLTLGFNPQEHYAIYASEAAAIDRVLNKRSTAYRLDLNQNAGEIAVLSATGLIIYSMTKKRELREHEITPRKISYLTAPGVQLASAATDRQSKVTKAIGFAACSQKSKVSIFKYVRAFLTGGLFLPCCTREQSVDPIEQDLRDLPRVLNKIQNTWLDPTSINRQSAEYLSFLIIKTKYLSQKQEKLETLGLDLTQRESRHVDLLITGVENSLWLGERFAQDLKAIFPLLSIKTSSSNQVLQKLQYDFESLRLGKQSIVLAISQSGQTFPTRQVLHACDLMVRQNIIREFFVLTGEPTSLLGSPLAQPTFSGEPFSRRIFVNESGRRLAEPATVSVAATHQTLTELLFCLTRQMHQTFPNSRPLGMKLSPEGLLGLERMNNEFLHQSVTDIMGVSTTGQVHKTRLHRQLIQGGRKWALHIMETPLAWFIHALYVLITVGWAIPFGYTIPLAQTLLRGMFSVCQLPQNAVDLFIPWLTLADIVIYIFGAWFWTLGLRLVQKRQLFARTGKRTLVIGDIPWVHQLLKTYVSKLFSLSYGIASLEIHGANPEDHLLHQFAHRVVRGTLLFLGIPDGRCSLKQQSQANAVLMTAKQASGIQNMGVGPEIVAVGSDPSIRQQAFAESVILPSPTYTACEYNNQYPITNNVIETLRESRFGSFERLLASYVFFWALAKRVATFPLLKYEFWKSQSRTKIMTTAAPVSAANLECPEPEKVANLDLKSLAEYPRQ